MVFEPLRAAVYSRVSYDVGGQALSVLRQEADCGELIFRRGWMCAGIYRENNVPASTHSRRRRPVFQRLLQDVADEQFDVVVAYSSSRLTRRPEDYEQIVDLHRRLGTGFATVVSGDLDLGTADGRAMVRVLAAMDAAEADRASERTSRALQQQSEAGLWLGGAGPPFAYEMDPAGTRRLVMDAVQAERLRDAARRIVQGETLTVVTGSWNDSGWLTRRGNRWGPDGLARILTSPHVAGLQERDGRLVSAGWPAVLDPVEWEAVRRRLVGRGHVGTPAPQFELELSPMALCSGCELPLHPGLSRHGVKQYQCRPTPRGCGKVRIRADLLQTQVRQAVDVHAQSSEHREQLGIPKLALTVLRKLQEEYYTERLDSAGFSRQLTRLWEKVREHDREALAAVSERVEMIPTPSLAGCVLDVAVAPGRAFQSLGRGVNNSSIEEAIRIRWIEDLDEFVVPLPSVLLRRNQPFDLDATTQQLALRLPIA